MIRRGKEEGAWSSHGEPEEVDILVGCHGVEEVAWAGALLLGEEEVTDDVMV